MPFATLKYNFRICILASSAILFGLAFLLFPILASAQAPIVQCGGPTQPLCNLCDLYSGTRRVINFLLFFLALPAATVAIIAAGIMFLISGGSEALRTQGKETLKWAVIGIILAFGGWVIVNTALDTLGYKGKWTDYSICQQFEGLIPNIEPTAGGGDGDGNKTINAGEEILGIADDIYEVMNPDDLAEIVALGKKGQNLASEDLKQALTLLEKNNLIDEEDIASGSKSPEDFVKALEKYPHLNPETRESVNELLAATSPELREYVFVETLSNPSLLDRVVKESASEADVYVDGFLVDEKNKYYKTELSRTSGEGNALRQEATFIKPDFPKNYNTKIDENYGAIIEQMAAKYGVDPARIKAVIMVESGGNPNAVNGNSHGLMQVEVETARNLDPANKGLSSAQIIEKLKNPAYNIELSTKHTADLIKKYKDPIQASAAYNGGPPAHFSSRDCPGLKAWECPWDNKTHTKPNNGFAVTRKYVQKIDELEKALRTGQ